MHIKNKNKIGTSDLQTTPKLSIKVKIFVCFFRTEILTFGTYFE